MFLFYNIMKFIIIFLIFITSITGENPWEQAKEVGKWANLFGNDLNQLGTTVTKTEELKQMYIKDNVQVERKDPFTLLRQIVNTISSMMKSKITAVRNIVQAAEKQAEEFDKNNISENYEYYSALYSVDEEDGTRAVEPTENLQELEGYLDRFTPMRLDYDTHFYNLSVNVTYSGVYVPYNVFDLEKNASYTIQWSEKLDEVFIKNYKRDPALSWQYFGAANGILRLYPAKKWEKHVTPSFDCRTRTWFIEAATCTKDAIILLDNSGSMEGMKRTIAMSTAFTILDTFSNNDYVNVLNFTEMTDYIIPCFRDILAQASKENIGLFKNAIEHMKTTNKTDVSQALETAFQLLEEVRKNRSCVDSSQCNQVIMLITDELSVNVSDIVMKYNYLNNGTHKPVRLFTYLVGRENTNPGNMLWMACNNRGYYTPVRSLDQVTSSVLEYINVIARPLVLSKSHPASWTHAYMDTTVDEKTKNYRLLTSVAIPAFDNKANVYNGTRVAFLLGVAGTDVPIDDIGRLTFPYKIGVNGYSFIISNNGYVLKHPNLQPMVTEIGQLKENYNSIDLMEVEQFDDILGPRQLNPHLVELRRRMVNRELGKMENITIKYHYDGIRRVTKVSYNYYFAPIKDTPFTLGLALPLEYGHFTTSVKDVITLERYNIKYNTYKLRAFFKGENWKIHPDWVYCRYHYLEGHEYNTPELELLDFLDKMWGGTKFVWEQQYSNESSSDAEVSHGLEDYYCDHDLVKRLVFDAKVTAPSFEGTYDFNAGDFHIIKKYNVSLRFLATMSGLTRWKYIFTDVENATEKEFGDKHAKAIDETWYKSAVLYKTKSEDSFVFSVPFSYALKGTSPLTVTVSHAIFLSDTGLKTPGAVVGYEMMYKNFKDVFFNITSQISATCDDCFSCAETHGIHGPKCYVLDTDGYTIISEKEDDVGKFFGEVQADIMKSLILKGYFEPVEIYDYQAYCEEPDDESSAGETFKRPKGFLESIYHWIMVKLTWILFEFCVFDSSSIWGHHFAYAAEQAPEYTDEELSEQLTKITSTIPNEHLAADNSSAADYSNDYDDEEIRPHYLPCEQQSTLFIFQKNKMPSSHTTEYNEEGESAYYITKIPFTNMLLIAVNKLSDSSNSNFLKRLTNTPQPIEYENEFDELPCQKRELNDLERKRLTGCFYDHKYEKEIQACGQESGAPKQISIATPLLYIGVFCTYVFI